MSLSSHERQRVVTAARALLLQSPGQRVENFISGTLGLNPVQQGQYFPSPDPKGLLAIAVGYLTAERETILREECTIPTFAVFYDRGIPQISGLSTYLAKNRYNPKFIGRLAHYNTIRTALRTLDRGHHLEALAAAIMNQIFVRGEATQPSGDEGVDAIGWLELLTINGVFIDGGVSDSRIIPGERVLFLASSKAVIGKGRGRPRLLDVAHIRELVGGWVIQRSPIGKWKEYGIQTLTPIQLVLVTTYRMSIGAKAQCRSLGIQVWGIPELIYLICKFAPDALFDAAKSYAFSAREFREWWKERDRNRVIAA